MKKKTLFITLFFSLIFLGVTNNTSAQNNKSVEKTEKELKGDIKEKATKQAKKESKKLMKEGYKVTAGALPMEKQLDNAWKRQYELDDVGFPKYIVANAKSIGENYSAAKNQALNLAKTELAGLITTHVAGLAENSVANQDLSKEEAASIVKTLDASKNIIAQEFGRILPLFEVYKNLSNKNVEVQIRIAYNSEMAIEAAKTVIRKKLEVETAITHEKLEDLMGMDGLKKMKSNSNVPE